MKLWQKCLMEMSFPLKANWKVWMGGWVVAFAHDSNFISFAHNNIEKATQILRVVSHAILIVARTVVVAAAKNIIMT